MRTKSESLKDDEYTPFPRGENDPFAAAFRNALDGLALLSLDGRFREVNRSLCEILGRPETELLAMAVRDILVPDDLDPYLEWERDARREGTEAFHACLRSRHVSGASLWIDLHQSPICDGQQRSHMFLLQIRAVTRQLEATRQHNMALQALQILHPATDLHSAAESLLDVIQRQTGIEAAGIRMARDADFKYIAHRGFSPEFILAEDSLCAHSADGSLLCSPDGKPRLACTCGLVIEGRTDATDSLYSPRGSAWTNDMSSFSHTSPSLAQRLYPRNLCLREGYRSIALIPIKAGASIVGLLQMNDRRPGQFSLEKIAFLEDLASSFGIMFERLNTEERLRASLVHLGLAFEAAKAGSWEWNLRTGENLWSDSLWALYGLDPRQHRASYETWLSVIHPDDRASAERSVQRATMSGLELNAEWRVCLPGGETHWLLSRGRPIRDAQGHFDRYVGISMDIDDRKRAEEVLRETEHRYNQVSEHNRTITWEVDASGLYTYVCRVTELVLGYRPDEIVGKKHFYDLHPADGREAFKSAAFGVIAQKESFLSYDNRCETKDGRVLWMRTSGLPTLDANGNLLGYRGIDIDVTALKQVEDAHAFLLTCGLPSTGEDFFASLSRYLAQSLGADAVCIDQLDGNGKVAHTLALCVDGKLLDNVSYLLADSPCGEVYACKYRAYAQDLRQTFTTHPLIQQLNAESYAGIALLDSAERKIGLVAVMRRQPMGNLQQTEAMLRLVAPRVAGEIERRRTEEVSSRLQAQLNQAQKMESVGRLAGGVAHDFNNMLGVIIGNAELCLSGLAPNAPVRDDMQEILKAAKRSADLTRQLLAFARKQTIQPKVIDLNQTIVGMLKMLGRLIGENIELVWNPHIVSAPALIDPTQVDQILANLVINARDAITGTGKLVIETDRVTVDAASCAGQADATPGDYVLLTVSDNGCGMKPETLDHLFEPFFTTKRMGAGTGLGLATIYGIVKQNRGFVLVHSRPGEGSAFKIHLPFYDDSTATSSASDDHAPATHGHETVLLVEDEAALLNTNARILRALGYSVLSASSANEALQIAASPPKPINLLITDIVMPGMNGLALSKELLARQPKLKCLYMSGYTADVIPHRNLLPTGAKLIEKPFTSEDLGRAVREILSA